MWCNHCQQDVQTYAESISGPNHVLHGVLTLLARAVRSPIGAPCFRALDTVCWEIPSALPACVWFGKWLQNSISAFLTWSAASPARKCSFDMASGILPLATYTYASKRRP